MSNVDNKKWILGEDLIDTDNILDSITFKELITTVHCKCRKITDEAVMTELNRILEIRQQDMEFLVRENMDVIIAEAKKGRD